MSIVRRMFVVLLVVGLGWAAWAQIAPPDTGKFSWDLFQIVQAGRSKRALGEAVPPISAILTTRAPATEEDLATLKGLGYTVLAAFGRLVQVSAPEDLYADPVKGVAGLDFVLSVSLPPKGGQDGSATITDGTVAIGADRAWELGSRGQGTKIAIIEWGYYKGDPTLAQRTPAPKYYFVRPVGGVGEYRAEEGQVASMDKHGTSCAIIVGDVAPEAELYLLSIPKPDDNDNLSFMGWIAALKFAVEELKVDVVSTQIFYFQATCHADGTGVFHEIVDGILNESQTMVTVSAGNWAAGRNTNRWTYSATFNEDPVTRRHQFDPNASDALDRTSLWITGRKGDVFWILLEWDEWAALTKTVDLDLVIYDAEFPIQAQALSRTAQYGNTVSPFERMVFELPYSGKFAVVIENRASKWHRQPATNAHFHMYFMHVSFYGYPEFEHHTACGSVNELATSRNPRVISVGAVGDARKVRDYSSRGPTYDGRPKPEVYAPDCVTGTLYSRFCGTSASAPHVAGAIALVRSVAPGLSPEELLAALRKGAEPASCDGCSPICNAVFVINVLRSVEFVLAGR